MGKTMTFNGGKQLHIFNIVDNYYVNEFVSEETKDAFENGIFYDKIDGANGYCLDGVLYERYDDRNGKINPKNLPEDMMIMPNGQNPISYENHRYYYKVMNRNTDSKKLKKVYDILYNQSNELNKNGSVEFIGPNFQATPGYTVNMVKFHTDLIIDGPDNRTFEGIRSFLLNRYSEGVVIEHKGRFWKIRANVFDNNCKYEKLKKIWIKHVKKNKLTEEEQTILDDFNKN